MKKILTLVLCLSMVLASVAVFASCGKADYKLGMGVVVSMDSSATGNAQDRKSTRLNSSHHA